MNNPDLETTIRSYYRTFEPDDSPRLALASARLLEDARRPQPKRFAWTGLRLAVTAVGAAVLLAVLVVPRLGPAVGPAPGTTAPGPTFDATAAVSAQVDSAGLMRSGGIWAVQGSYFLTSTDNGATWRAGTFPLGGGSVRAATVFVLDPAHAWAIDSGPSAGLPLDVVRTSDGGRTWQSTPVSGNFRCDSATLSFVNANSGFLMCSYGSTSGPNGSNNEVRTQATKGAGTVLRTDDGGATWSVAGSAAGLGSQFTASDANTLWSAPDNGSSFLTGPNLYVSRDAGVSWSVAHLPELPAAPLPGGADVRVAAGPVFWDPANGAIAIGVYENGSGTPPAIWFYRTQDAGRSWTVVKKDTDFPMMDFPPAALVGREWAARMLGNYNLAVSDDFGASWTDGPGFGMPANTSFIWVDLIDRNHGAATVLPGYGVLNLMLTADGGRTWNPADFGDARSKVSSTSADPTAAKNLAEEFETMAVKGAQSAWDMLSPYSQKAFGTEPAFEANRTALAARTNYEYQLAAPVQTADLLSSVNLGRALWDDLTASADLSRAYVVGVSYTPGNAEPSGTIVVAPLAATGEWRVWVAGAP